MLFTQIIHIKKPTKNKGNVSNLTVQYLEKYSSIFNTLLKVLKIY